MPQLYGLIFDVDGVVADTEPLNAKVTIRVLKDMFGLEGVTREDFAAGIGRGAEAYVKAGAKAHGLELTDEQAKTAAERRERYLIEALARGPAAGVSGRARADPGGAGTSRLPGGNCHVRRPRVVPGDPGIRRRAL